MSKLCLFLPNISHAGRGSRGNIPEIAKKYEYECKLYDRPMSSFDEKEVMKQLHALMHTKEYEKIVIISNSFGDIIARKVLRKIGQVHGHISICGVGSLDDITISSSILLHITQYIRRYFYRSPWVVRKAAALFNREKSVHAHTKAHEILIESAVQGLKKGIIARAKYMLHHREHGGKISTPAYILFSEDDNNFIPERNAEHIAELYNHATIISLGKAGHGSAVEMPEKYDPVIEDIFSRM